jgi:membrane-bound serine protease (ClpP class)
MEIFVIPGFGLFGISGALAIFSALVLASQTFVLPSTSSEVTQMTQTMGTLSIALVSVIGMAALLSRWMPQMPLLKHLILSPPNLVGDEDAPQLRPDMLGNAIPTGLESLINQEGEAFTMLRPAGKARIGDQILDVISHGDLIDAGERIVVSSVSGNRVIVRKA